MYKIFVSGMAYDEGKSGISDYMNNVIAELVKNHQVDLLMLASDAEIFPVKSANLNFIKVSNKLGKPIFNMLWHLFILPGTIEKQKYDFVFLPAGNRRIMFKYLLPTLVTFHDLSQFHISAKYDGFRMFYIKKVIPLFLKKADKIMVISKNTRDDLVKYYHFKTEELEVNYNGYDDKKYVLAPKTRNYPLSLKKEYFLYIARIEHPGKNHLRLIKAYERLSEDIKNEYDLVMPGKAWSGSDEIIEYLRNSRDKDKIHLPGFVANDVLLELYQHSSLYIFPSLYEGFGIPLIEAMACGIPVVCSNTSSLPEIGGDAVAMFDPYSIDSIRDTIARVISDNKMQQAMIENGLQRIKEFSWHKHADKIISCFEEINEQRK